MNRRQHHDRGHLAGIVFLHLVLKPENTVTDLEDRRVNRDRIAGDEFRHYKTFYERMKLYAGRERIGLLRRVMVAVDRIRETDDDELAYAWHAANDPADMAYDLARCNLEYGRRAYGFFGRLHAERATTMVLKAIGLDPKGWLGDRARRFAWSKMQQRARKARAA